MQRQYFTLSPMAGQENFGSMDIRPNSLMAHTPTTSSMLAALQNDPFSSSLDPTASAFGSDAYGSMQYMDPTTTQEDALSSSHQAGLTFNDFSGPGFDVGSYSQDLAISVSATTQSESEHKVDSVKADQT